MKKHILLVSQYFPPDITAAAFRIGSLCDFLRRHNYQVTILTSHPHKTSPTNFVYPPESAGDNPRVLRIKIPKSGYIAQYLTFIISGFLKIFPIMIKDRVDVVFATSPPLSVFFLGFMLSRLKRAPLIMDIRDLWPDTPAALGKMRDGSLAHRFFKRYESFMYRSAHWITCVSAPMKEEISRISPKKTTVIYNGIPEVSITRTPPARNLQGNQETPIQVYYYGNIGLAQGLDTLIDAATMADSRFQFHLVGDGALKPVFIEKIRLKDLSNIRIHDPLPQNDLVELINREAHILFINLEDDPVFHRTIPSKLFDYLLHCLPVVYGIHGEGGEILCGTNAAVSFASRSPDSLLNALDTAAANYPELLKQARANNPAVASRYTREKNYKKLLKIIENSFYH